MMKQAILFFALGVLTDILVVRYYLAIAARRKWAAAGLSFVLTLFPLFVAEQGIVGKGRIVFLAFAAGAAVGTFLGMIK